MKIYQQQKKKYLYKYEQTTQNKFNNHINNNNQFNLKICIMKTNDKIIKDNAISVLDSAYSAILNLVRSNDDFETINLIQPILDKIDEIQNEIEEL